MADASAAASRAAGFVRPFDLALEGIGAFPPAGPPRIIWAACGEGRESLVGLAGAVESAFEEAGFPRETRPFSPHLTIGRVKDLRGIPGRPLREALARGAAARLGPVVAREIVLFRSDLSPAGPAYTPLVRVPLGRTAVTPAS